MALALIGLQPLGEPSGAHGIMLAGRLASSRLGMQPPPTAIMTGPACHTLGHFDAICPARCKKSKRVRQPQFETMPRNVAQIANIHRKARATAALLDEDIKREEERASIREAARPPTDR